MLEFAYVSCVCKCEASGRRVETSGQWIETKRTARLQVETTDKW